MKGTLTYFMSDELYADGFLDATSDCTLEPESYQYYNNLSKRRIIINEPISENLLELAIIPFMDMDSDGSGEPIEIILSTNGGDVYSGFNLIDVIEKSTSPVTIKIMSMAASMGTLIAMAGKSKSNVKSVCYPFSVGLIHGGFQYFEGIAHIVKDTFDFSQRYEEKVKDYIISHTNIDEDMYEKIERKDFWVDSSEMLRLGIVDEIL